MEQKLTKDLLLQYANHSSEKVRTAYLDRICDELLKGKNGLLNLKDVTSCERKNCSVTSLFKLLPLRALLKAGEEGIWENFFAVVSNPNGYDTEVFNAVLKLYRHEQTPPQIKERCWQWLQIDRSAVQLSTILPSLLKRPYDDKLVNLALEKCKKDINLFVADLIANIDDEELDLKLKLIKAVIGQKVSNINSYLAGKLLNGLSSLSPERSKKYAVTVIETVIAALKDLPEKFEVKERDIKLILQLQSEVLISPAHYIELLNTLIDGCDYSVFRLEGLLPGLMSCLKEDKKNFVLVNKTLQKVLALDDLSLRLEALYIHACVARFLKNDKDFQINHYEEFKQLLHQYSKDLSTGTSSRFEDCYTIWFSLDEECFFQLVKIAPMFGSKEICKLLNLVADKMPQGWKKVYDMMDYEDLINPKSVILTLIDYIVKPEYDAIRIDAGNALHQLLKYRFDNEDADCIFDKLKKFNLEKMFTVLRLEDPQEIAEILELLNK